MGATRESSWSGGIRAASCATGTSTASLAAGVSVASFGAGVSAASFGAGAAGLVEVCADAHAGVSSVVAMIAISHKAMLREPDRETARFMLNLLMISAG